MKPQNTQDHQARATAPCLRASVVILLALLLGLPGCGLATALFTPGPKPAKTEIVPGRSEISSEQEIQQPSRTRVVIRSERAPDPAPPSAPVYRVKVTVGK